ncbi:MAG TPA: hypothetical protein VM537_09630, partial [Anaerolineae bacterium]|nr:hypothetical protein [Anaerolineae bacterium]
MVAAAVRVDDVRWPVLLALAETALFDHQRGVPLAHGLEGEIAVSRDALLVALVPGPPQRYERSLSRLPPGGTCG